jgi:hypothetical protein
MSTSTPCPRGNGPSGTSSTAGRRQRVSNSAATSRATPACESASGRLGVTLTSRISSSTPSRPARSAPGVNAATAMGDRIKIPSPAAPSAPTPSSVSLHSMPGDETPRTSLRASVSPPGRRAPGGAQATSPPTAGTLGAPHTTSSSGAPLCARTRTIESFSDPGCGFFASTSATTTPPRSRPRRSIDSTSRPASVSFAATESAVTPGGSSTSSRSQLKEIFIASASCHRNCPRKRWSFS